MKKKWRWEDDCIGFNAKDLKDVLQSHEDALVITLQVRGYDIGKVLVD